MKVDTWCSQNGITKADYYYRLRRFALHLKKTDSNVSLVTVGGREFYVYRYGGKLNDIPNAAVILSYPKEAFGNPRALKVFISTNVGLSTQEILDNYTRRWPIELFFCQRKGKLALDKS